MKIKFDGKIWKSGNSFVITVPSDYIRNGQVPEDTVLATTIEVPDVD